jgi:hypothetical protein
MSDLTDEISLLIIGSIEIRWDSKIFIPASLAEQIASKCCGVAIQAVKTENLSGETDCPEDTAYMNAIDNAILAIKEAFNTGDKI